MFLEHFEDVHMICRVPTSVLSPEKAWISMKARKYVPKQFLCVEDYRIIAQKLV